MFVGNLEVSVIQMAKKGNNVSPRHFSIVTNCFIYWIINILLFPKKKHSKWLTKNMCSCRSNEQGKQYKYISELSWIHYLAWLKPHPKSQRVTSSGHIELYKVSETGRRKVVHSKHLAKVFLLPLFGCRNRGVVLTEMEAAKFYCLEESFCSLFQKWSINRKIITAIPPGVFLSSTSFSSKRWD